MTSSISEPGNTVDYYDYNDIRFKILSCIRDILPRLAEGATISVAQHMIPGIGHLVRIQNTVQGAVDMYKFLTKKDIPEPLQNALNVKTSNNNIVFDVLECVVDYDANIWEKRLILPNLSSPLQIDLDNVVYDWVLEVSRVLQGGEGESTGNAKAPPVEFTDDDLSRLAKGAMVQKQHLSYQIFDTQRGGRGKRAAAIWGGILGGIAATIASAVLQ